MPHAPSPDPGRHSNDPPEVEHVVPTIGHAAEMDWWMTDAEGKRYEAEIRRKEKARRELGGFGFRPRT